MKKALKILLVVVCLSLPLLANSPKKKTTAMPEGGNLAGYTIVSGAAILGALLVARKKRATDPHTN